MIEELYRNIFRIKVPLKGNPLHYVNDYLIRGEARDLLIDTAFRTEDCRAHLRKSLQELHADPDRLDILLTHMHWDHSGLAPEIAGSGSRIFISSTDYRVLRNRLEGETQRKQRTSYARNGFPDEILGQMEEEETGSVIFQGPERMDGRFTAVEDGAILRAGGYELRTILVPGHTPGNCMFWIEKEGIMFTGDHVLFDITPNITCNMDMHNMLGRYLNSLKKVRDYPVRLALPGHRESGNYAARIDELLEHHKKRLSETERIIRRCELLNAYEITSRMSWKIRARSWEEFPLNQKWFAFGECMAHLEYLEAEGTAERVFADGVWRWRAIRPAAAAHDLFSVDKQARAVI